MPQSLFDGPPPEEIKLSRAPLARVIGQVRFPPNLALAHANEVSGFQKAIRRAYPLLSRIDIPEFSVSPSGEMRIIPQIIWKFSDADSRWEVALSTTFVALETRSYTNRQDFLARLTTILQAADEELAPQIATRIGLRYVNRVTGSALEKLSEMVRPEVQGMASLPLAARIKMTMTESQLDLGETSGKLILRHGLLPAMATYDPSTLEPSSDSSWILDIDALSEESRPFDSGELSELASQFAERVYRLFRWVVTPAFLKEYGA